MNAQLVKYAARHGHRYWGWLYRAAPQDFSQTVQMCALMSPSFVGMGRVVNGEMNRLAKDLGFHRSGDGWTADDQLIPRVHAIGKTPWKFDKRRSDKCPCEDCKKPPHRATVWRRKKSQ